MTTRPLKAWDGSDWVDLGVQAPDMSGYVTTTDSRLSDTRTPTNNTVSTAKVQDGAVTDAKLAGDSVTTAKIAANSVTTAKIADSAVTTGKIANSSVDAAKIVDGSVGTSEIADAAVTSAKIADGTIVDADINASAAIAQSKVANLPTDIAAKADKATIGNLLTANRASVETDLTGLAATNACTIARITSTAAHGSACLEMTAAATSGNVAAGTPRPGAGTPVAVTPGETYTGSAAVKYLTGSRTLARLMLIWWTSGGSPLPTTADSPNTVVGTSFFTTLQATGVAPADAAYVSVEAVMASVGSVGDKMVADCFGLWKGTGGQWAMPGTPILGLEDGLSKIGNLLPANVASGTDTLGDTTGFVASACTVASSTDQAKSGTKSLKVTLTTSLGWTAIGGSASAGSDGSLPVVPGTVYTFSMWVHGGTSTATRALRVAWWTAARTVKISDVDSSNVVLTGAGWTLLTVRAIAPATAAFATMFLNNVSGGNAGEVFYLDQMGVWVGASGDWQMPGVPIPHTGILPTAQTPVPQAKLWAGSSWAPQPVIIGSGSPLNIVVPDFKGQEFVDTAQTLGARKWVATSTLASGWVVSDGDTGLRDIAASLNADWELDPGAGSMSIRRLGNVVVLNAVVRRVTASGVRNAYHTVYTVPSGFLWKSNDYSGSFAYHAHNDLAGYVSPYYNNNTVDVIFTAGGTYTAGEVIKFRHTWTTRDAWPTSLPGSAA